jgi:uncharacterized protein (TIGR00299 family) protein
MFAAALLDALPDLAEGVIAAAEAGTRVRCQLLPHRDQVLAGSRFLVEEVHEHGHHHHGPHHHGHAHWADMRRNIGLLALPEGVRARAIAIFAGLADAEAAVHGIPPDEVAFHEVGAADSIADILAAAFLIEAVGPASWSVGTLPLGGGFVQTAHGRLPVPAPATALLLRGFAMGDDGVDGERVTPTGAAILRQLGCGARPPAVILRHTGIGFGTRSLPGISNCLRALIFETQQAPAPATHRELLVISFEVDDQSGEDLAAGLDRLRALDGVHDALMMPAYGKKGRIASHIQVLADPACAEAAIAACFAQTTTIGLRTHLVAARALPRRVAESVVDGVPVRVKLVERPGGLTGKAEAADLAGATDQAARDSLRRRAEGAAS